MDMRFNEAMPVECAIARAGTEIMLCIELRSGRLPIRETLTDGAQLAWVCADGVVESPYLTGATAEKDLRDLISEFQRGSILVTEISDGEDHKPQSWLMVHKC